MQPWLLFADCAALHCAILDLRLTADVRPHDSPRPMRKWGIVPHSHKVSRSPRPDDLRRVVTSQIGHQHAGDGRVDTDPDIVPLAILRFRLSLIYASEFVLGSVHLIRPLNLF
jgi:hypothetical protein